MADPSPPGTAAFTFLLDGVESAPFGLPLVHIV